MSKVKDSLFGLAVGDALGVPVEFTPRDRLAMDPVVGMRGMGVHRQPIGTWSDDSSLAFCLAEAMTHEFSMERIAKNFEAWLYDLFWTPHGKVFDIGGTTRIAIESIAQGRSPEKAGPSDELSQGNGSLMRILPLVFHIKDKGVDERWDITRRVSNITHGHINCAIACFIYLEIARNLLAGKDLRTSCSLAFKEVESLHAGKISLDGFSRILDQSLFDCDASSIRSSGYVIDTLEASLWCINNSSSYEEATLKGVNLGEDTDTTGAVVGGLAGIIYGLEGIPSEWMSVLVKKDRILELAERLESKYPAA